MKLFNPELIWDSCRGFWKLESIDKHDVFEVCYYLDFFKISNNGNYSFSVSEENTVLLNTMKNCNLQYGYTFSGWQLPNIWDTIYFTSEYWYNRITWFWKDVYDWNSNYIDCLQYVDVPAWSYNDPLTYKIITPCKISWKIENISRSFTNICWLNLDINLKKGEETYIIWWREYFTWKWLSLCLWNNDWSLPIDITNWKITKNINQWDSFYAIVDSKDNTILKYWENNYNNADTSIPFCNVATNKQIEAFTWWLDENQIKQIMDWVEKELIKTYSDFNNISVIDTVELIDNSSWIISNTIKNPEEKITTETTKPAKNVEQKITKNITLNNVNSWTILEKQTWSNKIEEYINLDEIEKNINVVNTWSIQALEQNQVQDTKYQSNYIFFWILLICLFFIFFYKKIKSKK